MKKLLLSMGTVASAVAPVAAVVACGDDTPSTPAFNPNVSVSVATIGSKTSLKAVFNVNGAPIKGEDFIAQLSQFPMEKITAADEVVIEVASTGVTTVTAKANVGAPKNMESLVTAVKAAFATLATELAKPANSALAGCVTAPADSAYQPAS